MLAHIWFDSIPLEVDKELSQVLLDFFNAVINDQDASPSLKQFYTSLLSPAENENGREWHIGGPKRQMSMQLDEVAFQMENGLAWPAEGFMFDDAKHTYLVTTATDAVAQLITAINTIIPAHLRNADVHVFHIGTWATGKASHKLSSAIVTAEHVVGGPHWEDVIDEALYPNGKTAEEIFAYNFTTAQLDTADGRFCGMLQTNANTGGVRIIFVDVQDYMYTDLLEPQRIAYRLGFRHVITVLGGEIIMFRQNMVILLFHGHMSIAGDSRRSITFVRSQIRGISISVMRQTRRYGTGEASSATDGFDDAAIFGTEVVEVLTAGLHGSKKFAVAVYRDIITPEDQSALDTYGERQDESDLRNGMTPRHAKDKIKGTFMYPSSQIARDAFGTERPKGNWHFDKDKMFNRITYATTDDLHSVLDKLNNQIILEIRVAAERTATWGRIIGHLADDPAVDDDFVSLIEDWASVNGVKIRQVTRNIAKWTAEEDQVIRNGKAQSPKLTAATIAERLPGKSESQVGNRWVTLQKGTTPLWTAEEDQVIRNGRTQSPILSHATIAKRLPGKSDKQVKNRWKTIGRQDKRKAIDCKVPAKKQKRTQS